MDLTPEESEQRQKLNAKAKAARVERMKAERQAKVAEKQEKAAAAALVEQAEKEEERKQQEIAQARQLAATFAVLHFAYNLTLPLRLENPNRGCTAGGAVVGWPAAVGC